MKQPPRRKRPHLETLEERSSPTAVLEALLAAAVARARADAPALVNAPARPSTTLPPPCCEL